MIILVFIGVIPLALLVLFHVKNAFISRENQANNFIRGSLSSTLDGSTSVDGLSPLLFTRYNRGSVSSR